MSGLRADEVVGGLSGDRLGLISNRVPDSVVHRVIEVVESMGVLERIEEWRQEARKGPGGRPETFPLRALLVGLVIEANRSGAMHLTKVCNVLFRDVSMEMRTELGVPPPPAQGDWRAWAALYRNVRNRFHGLIDLMDPSDTPKNRRLDHDVYTTLLAMRQDRRSDAERQEAFERLSWFVNRLLEASFAMLPRRYRRRWKGSVAVDATGIAAFARRERAARTKTSRSDRPPVLRHSSDPDAALHVRTRDVRDDYQAFAVPTKDFWGYEASLVVAGDLESGEAERLPVLVIGMAPLHKPGFEPGVNGIRALASVAERGHPTDYLAADRAYSSAKAEDFQLPARALGWKPVFDYTKDQLGIMAESHGFIQVEGRWYCPAMPRDLLDATKDFRQQRIDEATYHKRIEARRPYEAKPKAHPDDEGHQRLLCPAAAGAVRCELKPKSEGSDGKLKVRIRPSNELKGNPPASCRQNSVTVPPEDGAKLAQELPSPLPSTAPSTALYAQFGRRDERLPEGSGLRGSGGGGASPHPWCGGQSVLVAFQIMAANIRKIAAFLRGVGTTRAGRHRRRRRRRTTSPVSRWRPDGALVAVVDGHRRCLGLPRSMVGQAGFCTPRDVLTASVIGWPTLGLQ